MTDPLTALVTGANKGLGKEVARQLGRLGATVLIGSRDHARGELAAAELVAQGLAAHAIQLDVTDAASIQAAAEEVQTRYGRLDVLATDLNGHSGPRTPEQGARIVVELATLPDDGPSGGFFNDDGQLPW
jgi:NAD(P)-dependent dehydrogenase (short-subunit alcohol dehydrogenase family)